MLIFTFPLFGQVEGLSGWNIFLDPGHSGKENMGVYGYSEAERNLRVALRLRDYLLETTDIDTVFLSRTNDQQNVSLTQRSDLANALGAAWFHSIHSDASGSPGTNSTLLLWGQYYNGQEKVPNGGKAMSDIMVDLLTRGMRIPTRGSIGDCSFYTWSDWCRTSGGPYLSVNRRTTMPSELSESGFHTNPRQNQLFMNDRWKKLEAMTFYWSMLQFHELERPFAGIVTGIIKDQESLKPINGAIVTIAEQSDTTDTFESLFHKYSNDPDLLRNGFYFIENLPDEPLIMTIEAPGYYGDTLEVTPSAPFFTFHDVQLLSSTPPTVVTTTPAHGDTNVLAWSDITIDFSRRMDRASVEANLTMSPDDELSYRWTGNYTRLIIRPDTLQFLTTYSITISGAATDRHNHPLDGNGDGVGGDDFTFSFKTGTRDRTPPVVVSFHPPLNDIDVDPGQIISFTFDEQINFSGLTDEQFQLKKLADGSLVPGIFEHYLVNEKSVLCFFPEEKLSPGEKYIGKLFEGVQDMFGNQTEDYTNLSFETRDQQYQIITIDVFEDDISNRWWNPSVSGSTTGIITDSTYRSTSAEYVNHLSGSARSMQLNYGWETGASAWLLRLYLNESTPKNVHFDENQLLQAYIFGDGSGNKIRFAVDDNVPVYTAANHEVSPWYTIDWIGWRLVSWDMANDTAGVWLGDGNLDGVLRFDSIQMTYTEGSAPFGTIYIDDLQLSKPKETGVELRETLPIVGDFQLGQCYPNPFNNNTVIPYVLYRQARLVKLSIYNTLGQKIAVFEDLNTAAGKYHVNWNTKNYIESEASSGIYYYELTVDEQKQTRKMIYLK